MSTQDNIEMCKYYLLKPIRKKYRYVLKKMEVSHGRKRRR